MKFWKCWFFHDWSVWKIINVTISYSYPLEQLGKPHIEAQRMVKTCERCGLIKTKKVYE